MIIRKCTFILYLVTQMILLSCLIVTQANAGANNTMVITLDATGACSLTVNALDFGVFSIADLSGASKKASTTMVATCSPGTKFYIGMSGIDANGDHILQNTTVSTAKLLYKLQKSSTLFADENWFELATEISKNNLHTVNGSGTPISLNIYGVIAANQTAVPGVYSDTIQVTMQIQ